MIIDDLTSNEGAMTELGLRIKDARIAFPLTQHELAQRAGVATKTVANLERGADVTTGSLISILRALGLLSRMELLVPSHEVRPSKIAAKKPKRQRAVSAKHRSKPSGAWKWGDEQ